MKSFILLLFLVTTYPVCASGIDVVQLRQLYYRAHESEECSDRFCQQAATISERSEPIFLCYKAMASFMRCRRVLNPYSKFSSFNDGKKLLEYAIKNDPNNVEIRFMRFCVQSQAPRILSYNDNLSEDKTAVLKGWKKIADNDLKEKIRSFMLRYGNCSVQERLYLQ